MKKIQACLRRQFTREVEVKLTFTERTYSSQEKLNSWYVSTKGPVIEYGWELEEKFFIFGIFSRPPTYMNIYFNTPLKNF